MTLCDYEELILLDTLLGNGTPATVYVGLCTGVTEGGVISGEPSGNNYARVAITNNSTNWPAASGGSKSNGTIVTFPVPSGAWGTVGKFFISTASSGNTNTILYGDNTSGNITPIANDAINFDIGGLVVTLD